MLEKEVDRCTVFAYELGVEIPGAGLLGRWIFYLEQARCPEC